MSKKIKFISLLLFVTMIAGMLPLYTFADSQDIYTKAAFDNLVLNNSGTESGGTLSYNAEYGTVYMNWAKGRELNSINAPSPETKLQGTSFTKAGETDKALQFNVVSGNTGSNYINISINASDLYSEEKLVFSMNTYVESYGYKGYLNADLRDAGSKKINNLFRFNNGGKIITFKDNNTIATSISRPGKKWFNLKMEFNTKAKTYDLYVDGVLHADDEKIHTEDLCFSGDPDTTKTTIGVLRLQMVSTNDTSYANFCVDDIYLGKAEAKTPEATQTPVATEIPEATATPSPTAIPTATPAVTSSPSATETPDEPSGQLQTFNQSNFDDLVLDNSGTESTTAITSTYKGYAGHVYMSCMKGRELNGVLAPSPELKMTDTSLSTSSTDKALQFNVVKGNTGSCYINISVDPNSVDMYSKDKVILSLNMYVESYGSKGYINADLRTANNTILSNLFRLNNGGKVIAYTTDDATAASVTRPTNKWFNLKFEFYPKTKTYDFYMDGVLKASGEALSKSGICFPGDTDSTKTPFTTFRMQMYSTDATSSAKFYVDDIFFGEEATDELKVNKLYFTNGGSPIVKVPLYTDTLYGKADVTYSKFTEDKDFNLIGALYNGDGSLEKLWITDSNLPETQLAANVYRTVTLDMPLSEVTLQEDSSFKLFAFSGMDTIVPLTSATTADIFSADENVGENPTIHLVGASLCMSYGEATFPQQGWGYYLGDYFKDNVTVRNWAIGSRSTRSFIDEGRWNGKVRDGYNNGATVTTGVLNVIKPGDYVFVSMGHNDRSTTVITDDNGEPYCKGTTIAEYKDYLRRYAEETRLAGGNIIFVTPITEAGGDNWTTKTFTTNTLLERSEAMKEVAEEVNAVVLDVNAEFWKDVTAISYQEAIDKYFMSKDTVRALFRERLTEEETEGKTEEEIEALVTEKVKNHPYNPLPQNGMDLVHVTDYGAEHMAYLAATLLNQSASPLKNLLNIEPDRSLEGKIQYNLYPNGLKKAVSMSFDDGKTTDRDVVEVLNKYNLKGTFNLVPAWLDTSGFLTSAEVAELFEGHEVACHGYSHGRIDNMTPAQFATDIINTQDYLKKLVGYDITGYAYPFSKLTGEGTLTQSQVNTILEENNILYARSTAYNMKNTYVLPDDMLTWGYQLRIGPESDSNTTADAFSAVQNFLNSSSGNKLQSMMLFAHGHEIQDYGQSGKESKGWDLFDELLESISGHEDVWYATCKDIAEYSIASNNVRAGRKTKTIKNSSDIPVWVTIDGVAEKILPNRIVKLN